jgi:hypothetical protein
MGITQFEATLGVAAEDSNLDGSERTGAQGERGQLNTVDPVRVKAEARAG